MATSKQANPIASSLLCLLIYQMKYSLINTETRIIEESIHVRFNDKLDPEKSNLFEKFAYLKINLSESKDSVSGEKDSEGKAKESKEMAKSEAIVDPTHRKKSRSRTSHSK